MSNFKSIYKIIVCLETSEFWFVSDINFHVRENKRLIEYNSDGSKHWYFNGKLHREEGPAVECSDGTKEWYLNDKCHRTNGPAIEFSDGSKYWYQNGERHREDGPAVEFSNRAKFWYFNGKGLSEKEFKKLKNV